MAAHLPLGSRSTEIRILNSLAVGTWGELHYLVSLGKKLTSASAADAGPFTVADITFSSY
jgi:hypothetical protein